MTYVQNSYAKMDYMSDEEKLFEELDDFSRELREDEEHYGYPYNMHNPKFNLNLISSNSIEELVADIVTLLSVALQYKDAGWELTHPVRFGSIDLHYNRDGKPERKEED